MQVIDVSDQYLKDCYDEVIDILLCDRTTKKNIMWATNNYRAFGKGYEEKDQIKAKLLIRHGKRIVKPRIIKSKSEQKKRSKDMAEIFTPAWVCNKQINMIDNLKTGVKNAFNKEIGDETWVTTKRVKFKNITWQKYVSDNTLEITCGEAPYLTSRYDVVSGEYIEPKNRIGILDRKLRVVTENTKSEEEWLEYAKISCESTYGFEYQGDNILLARENLLFTFIDFYFDRFKRIPDKEIIKYIATVFSWNVWQMDGLKMVVPMSCHKEETVQLSFLDDCRNEGNECIGCKTMDYYKHNGIYCKIKDWKVNEIVTFIDIMREGENRVKQQL